MKTAKKKQYIIDVLTSLRTIIWIEDLYVLLKQKGYQISIRTVYEAVKNYEAIGMLHCEVVNRRTMVSIQ